MSLGISDRNISPPAWISSAGMSSLPGYLYVFSFAIFDKVWTCQAGLYFRRCGHSKPLSTRLDPPSCYVSWNLIKMLLPQHQSPLNRRLGWASHEVPLPQRLATVKVSALHTATLRLGGLRVSDIGYCLHTYRRTPKFTAIFQPCKSSNLRPRLAFTAACDELHASSGQTSLRNYFMKPLQDVQIFTIQMNQMQSFRLLLLFNNPPPLSLSPHKVQITERRTELLWHEFLKRYFIWFHAGVCKGM
jgi:hypothetical protein